MIKRILVALSGTPYTSSAVASAVELAKLHDASITGVTVTDIKRLAYTGSVPIGGIAAAQQLEESRIQITEHRVEEAIAGFESTCKDAGVAYDVERETCDPLEELMNLWRYHDLTIFGLRGMFEYGVVHNPDDSLLRMLKRGVRPVLAVGREHRPIKRVLIAYNGSMTSAKSMKRFIQTQMWPDLSFRIITFERDATKATQLLAEAAVYCKAHGIDAETEQIDASAKKQLITTAHEGNYDLIVLGCSPRSLLIKHVLGDTVLAAVRESNIPLYLTQ